MKMKKVAMAAALGSILSFPVVATADLAQNLAILSPAAAIEKALQQEGATILGVMAQAAEILKFQPEALIQIVAAAVKANPAFATQIVYTVVQIVPDQQTAIAAAASSEISDPAIKAAIVLVAEQASQDIASNTRQGGEKEQTEFEAEQTEVAQETSVPPPAPPAVPPVISPPTSVSPS